MKEQLFYRTSVSYYASGEKHSVTDQRYKGGDFMNPVSGVDRLYAPDGSEERSRRWNPKEEKWEKWEKAPESTSDEISAPRDTSVCPINNYANQLVGGFNIIREDSTPDNFNTYGLDLSFTHNFVRDNTKNSAISHRVGVTADFNMNFRNLNGVDLTKTSVLGGVTLIPFHGLTTADKVTISLNALAGIAHLKSSVGSVSTSDNSFTWKVGGALDVNLSPH